MRTPPSSHVTALVRAMGREDPGKRLAAREAFAAFISKPILAIFDDPDIRRMILAASVGQRLAECVYPVVPLPAPFPDLPY